MPSLNGSQATLASELGTQMISMIGSFMETIHATPASPISSFPTQSSGNYVFVTYTNGGHPLTIGVVTESMGTAEIAQIVSNVRSLGTAGVAASQRIIDAGTASVALNLYRIIQGLLTVDAQVAASVPSAAAASAPTPAATEKKRRGPKKKAAVAPQKGRGGRPKKNADAAATAPKKGRGRPKRSDSAVPTTLTIEPAVAEAPAAEAAPTTRPAPKPRGGGKKRKATVAKGKRGAKKKSSKPASAPAESPAEG